MSDAVKKPTRVSREGVVLIKSFEGFRPRAIRRADGGWMIGYGHTRSAREGLTVSEADAELLLQYDLIPVVKAIDDVAAPLNQHQVDALASFAFSVGVDRFRTSDVLARLNAGAPAEAADALAGWADESAVDAPPRRRAAERALFVAAPDAPVSLAELLAAPLAFPVGPDAAHPSVAESPDAGATDAEDVAPFPAEIAFTPMGREAAVAALLGEAPDISPIDASQTDRGESVDDAPSDAAAAEEVVHPPATPEEAEPEPKPELAPEASKETVVGASAEDAAIEPSETAPAADAAAPKPQWPSQGVAAFQLYSPYGLRAVGPLPPVADGVARLAPDPLPAAPFVVVDNTAGEAPEIEAPEIEPPAAPAPANDLDAADAATEAEPESADLPAADEPIAPTPPEPETDAEPPIQTPVFASFESPAPSALVLTAPSLSEAAAPERVVWPETPVESADQQPLFEAAPAQDLTLSVPYADNREPPRRFDWSETGTFLVMGGIGLVSFGAAMAAFRSAGESGAGDTVLIGWVLAVIALACVTVSGYNLYQRWGRLDQARREDEDQD